MNNRGQNMGLLFTGMVLGATLCGGAAAAGIIAVPTWQPIYVDGQQVEMEAYNINGSNYVKLQDAGRQVGFNVYWDNGVQVDTDAPYTGVAPTVTAPSETIVTQDISAVKQEIIDQTNMALLPWPWMKISWKQLRSEPTKWLLPAPTLIPGQAA